MNIDDIKRLSALAREELTPQQIAAAVDRLHARNEQMEQQAIDRTLPTRWFDRAFSAL